MAESRFQALHEHFRTKSSGIDAGSAIRHNVPFRVICSKWYLAKTRSMGRYPKKKDQLMKKNRIMETNSFV